MINETEEILLTSKFIKQKGYWVKRLPPGLEKTEFFLKDKRALEGVTDSVEIPIPNELFAKLRKLGKGSDLSLYIILLTALKLLISGYTSKEDIVVVSPVYRPNLSAETINDRLFIYDNLDGELTFIEWLLEIRKSVLEAYENQDYPFNRLIEYLFSKPPIQNNNPFSDFVCRLANIHGIINIKGPADELVFSFEKVDSHLKGNILYNRSLYEKCNLELMSKHFVKVLDEAVRDVKAKVSNISFLQDEEKQQLIFNFNQTRVDYPKERTLLELIEEQVVKTPGNTALVHKGNQLTYHQLDEKANQLAWYLRAKGVKVECIVGIMGKHSIELVVGILAILKAGGAFLPIDPHFPANRIQFIMADSRAEILLTSRGCVMAGKINDVKNIVYWEQAAKVPGSNGANLPIKPQISPDNLAYVIYTSGSTGNPKGVMVNHQSILNYICWAAQYYVQEKHTPFPLFTSISFDLTITSLFTPLVTGSTIVVYREEMSEITIDRIVDDNKVGIIKLTPSHLKLIRDKKIEKGVSPIKGFIVGGEELEVDLAAQISKNFAGDIEIYNEYGPTEAAVGCMIYRFHHQKDRSRTVFIGKPINNMIIYILDKHQRPVSIGVPGELYIGGDGVARGYLNQVELTSERFLKNCFLERGRMYRSGDLGRWLPNGSAEFLGRIDNQVKLRGHRIELEEIRNQLLKHHLIKEAVVIVKEVIESNNNHREIKDKYLCAYVISDKKLKITELKEYLSHRLPAYMVPSNFVRIERIPLTSNGKVDWTALPEPKIETDNTYTGPGDEVEKELTKIWSEVLGIEKSVISIDANFFELGGHSLKATILAAQIHQGLNVKLSLETIFKIPTIRALAQYIKKCAVDRFMPVLPVEKKEYYLLSPAQKRMYIMQHMVKGSTLYNIPSIIPLEEELDWNTTKLEETFKKLIKRHESLRTSFQMIDEEPVQQIHQKVPFKIEYINFTTNQQDIEVTIQGVVSNFIRYFDLSSMSLLRVGVVKYSDTRFILLVDIHHIISDVVSHDILKRDFLALYTGEKLPELRIQYKDFSQWLQRDEQQKIIKQQSTYWLKEFAGNIPVLRIPTDYPETTVKDVEGSRLEFEISVELTKALEKLALEEEATFFMVLLAVYNIMLSKITGQEDIVIGIPAAGRRHADLVHVIGMFVNMLAIRNHPKGDKTFQEFLLEVREKSLFAFENQDYPFEDLVEQVMGGQGRDFNALFNTIFQSLNIEMERKEENEEEISTPSTHSDLLQKKEGFEWTISKYDLSFSAVKFGQRLHFLVEYRTRLFKKETIQRFVKYFKEIISTVTENKTVKLKSINLSHTLFNQELTIPKTDFGF